MKSLSYILLAFVLTIAYGCKETDKPYAGYIVVDRAIVEATGGSVTFTADTDISEPIVILELSDDGAEWCNVTTKGKEIHVTVAGANPSTDKVRSTTVNIRSGYRVTSFLVLQKYEGQDYLVLNWSNWSATGSDVQATDGGGYPSLFTDDRTTFWHSQYSPVLEQPLPHTIIIDMKNELPVAMVQIGRRFYPGNGNNYPTVKTMEVYASTDAIEYTLAGKFTFALPWTAPDGTIVTGNSPLVPGYEEVKFAAPVTARYMKLVITETNNTNGNCQVSFFKAYEKIL